MRWRLLISFFVFAMLSTQMKAQDAVNATVPSDQNSSFALLDVLASKIGQAIEQSENPKEQRWSFHVQSTEMMLGQPGFHSPYAGTNSI